VVVIDDFDVISPILLPYKTNAKLIVDTDAVLTAPVSLHWLQHISRRITEIVQTGCRIHPVEFSPSHALNASPSPTGPQLSQFRRVVVFETPNHDNMVGCDAFNVKQPETLRRRRAPEPIYSHMHP
jgi:hypothetical protein